MGGNVFKNNLRVNGRDNFYKILNEQQELLSDYVLLLPSQIDDKNSFGDMDLVIPKGNFNSIIKILENNNLPYKKNGIVLSYQTKDLFQIDLIEIDDDKINYAIKYFSYGDTGNILGRILKHTFHVKNSFNGLYYVFRRDSSSYKKEFLLSNNYDDVIDILELDKEKFKKGFKNNNELFEWIIQTPFLNTDIFKFENLNHTNRVRDRKRKFYNEWVTWLQENDIKNKEYLPINISDYFLDFTKKYDAINKEYEEYKTIKQKFNGNMVMSLTGLKGKELGQFIDSFKKKYGSVMDVLCEENIIKLIEKEYNNL